MKGEISKVSAGKSTNVTDIISLFCLLLTSNFHGYYDIDSSRRKQHEERLA